MEHYFVRDQLCQNSAPIDCGSRPCWTAKQSAFVHSLIHFFTLCYCFICKTTTTIP